MEAVIGEKYPQYESVGKKIPVKTRLLVLFSGLCALFASAQPKSGKVEESKSRVQWISLIDTTQREVINEAKSQKPSETVLKRGLEKLRSIVTDNVLSYELRLRAAISTTVACRWAAVRDLCTDTFATAVAALKNERQTDLANYLESRGPMYVPTVERPTIQNVAAESTVNPIDE